MDFLSLSPNIFVGKYLAFTLSLGMPTCKHLAKRG